MKLKLTCPLPAVAAVFAFSCSGFSMPTAEAQPCLDALHDLDAKVRASAAATPCTETNLKDFDVESPCPDAGIRWTQGPWGTVAALLLPKSILGKDPDDVASILEFVEQYSCLFGLGGDAAWDPIASPTQGTLVVRAKQEHMGKPVLGAELVFSVTAKSSHVLLRSSWVRSDLLPSSSPPDDSLLPPAIESELVKAAPECYPSGWGSAKSSILLGVVAPTGVGKSGSLDWGWRIETGCQDGSVMTGYFAEDGEVLSIDTAKAADCEDTRVYSAGYQSNPSNDILLCQTGGCDTFAPWPSGSTCEAAEALADGVEDYLLANHGRCGWDDAAWPVSSERQMTVKCDAYSSTSNGAVFEYVPNGAHGVRLGPASVCPDVVGHEFAHGVAVSTVGGFVSASESLAIVDGIGDAIGEYFEWYWSGSVDWLHGTGGTCVAPKRSLADPPSFTHSGLMTSYPDTYWNTNFSVSNASHWNSGFLAKLGFLLGQSGPPQSFGGISVEPLGIADAEQAMLGGILGDFSNTDRFDVVAARMLTVFSAGYPTWWKLQRALWAVGAWSLTGVAGIVDAGTTPSIATQAVNGQVRRYAFYRQEGTQRLLMRHRTCTLYGACTWQTASVVAYDVDDVVAVPAFGGAIHVFYRLDSSGALYYTKLDSSGQLAQPTRIPDGTGSGYAHAAEVPSVTYANSHIYLAYRLDGAGIQPIVTNRMNSSGQWAGETATGVSSVYGPAIAGNVEDDLWLLYGSGNGQTIRLKYVRIDTGGAISASAYVPRVGPLGSGQSSEFYIQDRPSAGVAHQRLYVLIKAQYGLETIQYGPVGAGQPGWSRAPTLVQESSWLGDPATEPLSPRFCPFAQDGRMYVVWPVSSGDVYYVDKGGW
jgi:hypothetical protein